MRELRAKSRSEVESHFDNPKESEIFKGFPKLLANADLVTFICDYCRLIIIGNAKTHEIEALMDEEIETLAHEKLQARACLSGGRRRTAGARHRGRGARRHPRHGRARPVARSARRPDRRGAGGHLRRHLPLLRRGRARSRPKIKVVRQKQLRLYILVKQSLLAFMNGAMPQVAVEFGRKTIPSKERPTIDTVENETSLGGGAGQAKEAA